MSVKGTSLDETWAWDKFHPMRDIDDNLVEWGCRADGPHKKRCTHHVLVRGVRVHASCTNDRDDGLLCVWDDEGNAVQFSEGHYGWRRWDDAIQALMQDTNFFAPTDEEVAHTANAIRKLLQDLENNVH